MTLTEAQQYLKDRFNELLSSNVIATAISVNKLMESNFAPDVIYRDLILKRIGIMNDEFNRIKIENNLYDLEGNSSLIKYTIYNYDKILSRIENLFDDYDSFKLAKTIKDQEKEKKIYFKDFYILAEKEKDKTRLYIEFYGRYETYSYIKTNYKNKALEIAASNKSKNVKFEIMLSKKEEYTKFTNNLKEFFKRNGILFFNSEMSYYLNYKYDINNLIKDLGLEEFQDKTII